MRAFLHKFKRACRFWLLGYKLPPWDDEYSNLIKIMTFYMEDYMAPVFENHQITVSAPHDAKRIRLCAKLLKMYMNEYYFNLSPEVIDLFGPEPEERSKLRTIAWNKDQKCLELACKILAQDIGGWWQ